MANNEEKNISKLFQEGTPIDRALAAAVKEAVLRHKQLGQPVTVWRDGKTVLIPPDTINLDDVAQCK
ncbi:MAG TPA: hypothetical protein VIH42_05455 [Thermoguttaceae bacterium]